MCGTPGFPLLCVLEGGLLLRGLSLGENRVTGKSLEREQRYPYWKLLSIYSNRKLILRQTHSPRHRRIKSKAYPRSELTASGEIDNTSLPYGAIYRGQ